MATRHAPRGERDARDERHHHDVLRTTDRAIPLATVRREPGRQTRPTEDEQISANSEALRPGISWNATRAASVLMVVIIAVIALVFWPSLTSVRPEPTAAQPSTGMAAAAPTDRGQRRGLRAVPAVT